jgi:cytochrome c553
MDDNNRLGIRSLLVAGWLALAGSACAADKLDLARAEEIVGGRCFLCHGMEGDSSTGLYPRLASQHREYIAKQLADFKSGRRKSDTMASMAGDLTPEEMKSLGAFFESKKSASTPPSDSDLAGVGRYIFNKGNPFSGVAACNSCHGVKGYGTSQLPRLAGQQPMYIEAQLKSFNKRERTNDSAIMGSIASRLSELEIKAVAEYIGSLE